MAVSSAIIASSDESFKLGDVLRVCEINHINGDIVSSQSHSKFFEVFLFLSNWMTNEYDDSLFLSFLLPVLKRELSYLDSGEQVGFSV